eukprot:111840-Amphidinium_carterae.1
MSLARWMSRFCFHWGGLPSVWSSCSHAHHWKQVASCLFEVLVGFTHVNMARRICTSIDPCLCKVAGVVFESISGWGRVLGGWKKPPDCIPYKAYNHIDAAEALCADMSACSEGFNLRREVCLFRDQHSACLCGGVCGPLCVGVC